MPTVHPLMLAWGGLFAAGVAWGAYRLGTLTRSGAISAFVLGTVIFGLGGWSSAAALMTFFITSSLLSRWRRRSKQNLGFEKTGRRDAAQVWANGGVAMAGILLPFLIPGFPEHRAHFFFLAALAAANADTWATEIGAALGGRPRLVTNGRPVPQGTSGGVTGAGTLAALLGAALLAAFAGDWRGGLVVTIAGMAGALFDSLLGATVQAQWRDEEGRLTEKSRPEPPTRGLRGVGNDLVNLLCTLVAAGVIVLLAPYE